MKLKRLLIFLIPVSAMTAKDPTIHYSIAFPEAHAHYAKVEIKLQGLQAPYVDFSMPSWTPGSYLLREFAKSVERVEASADGKQIPYKRIDKNTWRIASKNASEIRFMYHVYAFEWSVRTSFIDADMAFMHNTSLFMQVKPFSALPGTLTVELPEAWKQLHTSLEPVDGKLPAGTHRFRFSSYDELADEPLLAGNQDTLQFEVAGVPHLVAIAGKGNHAEVSFRDDLKKICETTTAIIGELPCKRYTFFVLNTEAGGGGLEHANSSTVMMPRWQWNNAARYKQFLGLCGHEYFHLWNVKRIRPEALGPFDYSKENHTRMLWVAEGITSYYDELILRRAGFYTREAYLEKIAGYINDLENRPGRHYLSLAESSWDAWIREYRPNENSKNTGISYYLKGQVVAFLLDVQIVAASNGRRSLDDVMKVLWADYKKRPERGFSDEEFVAMVNEVAGKDLRAFLDQFVNGVETPDYAALLKIAGIQAVNSGKEENTLGMQVQQENGRWVVKYVERGLGAWNAGVSANDELIAINGMRIQTGLEEIYRVMKPDNSANLLVSRAGLIRNIDQVACRTVKRNLWKLEAKGTDELLSSLLD
jgi:predicted metalloprotease with PDZ domain